MKKRIIAIVCMIVLAAMLMACAAQGTQPPETPVPSAQGSPGTAAQLPTVLPTQTATPTPEPTPTPDPTLKIGVESEAVMALQKRLSELGYLKIDEFTTKYGPATQRAVTLFQKQNALSADGIAGSETLSRIYADDAKECTLPLSGIVIGIDPGHQAKGNSATEPQAPDSSVKKAKVSSGADGKNTGTPEYKITLAVGLKLRDLLEENGAEVVMTRESSDVDISNKQRAQLFNDAGVDLAVRLHCDGVDDSSVHGALMLVPSGPYTEGIAGQSRAAGEAILSAFVDETGAKNRGISERDDQTGFNWSSVPVCNMEMGCLSNGNEEELLISDDYQQKCAQGVLQGILDYFA